MKMTNTTGLVRITVKRDPDFGEWAAVYYLNGKRHEARTYYAADKEDATTSAEFMRNEARAAGYEVATVSPKGER